MKTNVLTIHTTIEPTDEVADMANRLAIKQGWGVFEDRNGLSEAVSSRLRDVRLRHEEAEAEARRLDEIEGMVEFALSGYPEGGVVLQVSFRVSQVKLTDVQAEIRLYSMYESIEN